MDRKTIIPRLARAARHPIRAVVNLSKRRYCWACGGFRRRCLEPRFFQPEELIAGHGYTAEWTRFMNLREGELCGSCGRNGRSRQIAMVLVRRYGSGARSLARLVDEEPFRALAIAEINQCAQLHNILAGHPRLRYSEYGSTDPGVPSEDVLNLSYPDSSFDLVLTSDTLEHVPDCERALAEIRRVLRPGGYHIFTIPVVWDQAVTRRRSYIEDGRLVHVVPPVYHGGSVNPDDCLAFYDYGADILETVRASGFAVELIEDPRNRALKTLVTRKVA